MTKITKEQVLENLEDVKKYVNEAESEAENEVEGIAIKNRWTEEIIFQSTKTTLGEAVEEAVENYANLHYADLCDADLYGFDLREANLREANLSGADLRYATLDEANLLFANLYKANLSDANLCNANLYGADLRDANLGGDNLQNVKFYGEGGFTRIEKSQVEDLLEALGISVNK